MIAKMNQTGVSYKPGNMEGEEENLFGEHSESRFEDKFPQKEFPYDDVHTPDGPKGDENDDFNSQGGTSYKCTPGHLSSFKGDKDDPIDLPEESEKNEPSSLRTDEIASSKRWRAQANEQELSQGMSDDCSVIEEKKEVILGKRRRTMSKYQKSPFVQNKPKKRAKRCTKASKLTMLLTCYE
jgi:hypothetical protein